MATTIPRQFGRYRVLKQLGAGGMGTVYLAEDTQLGRRVALKVPHFTPQDPPSTVQRFYREARVAASLEHPNICNVYDVGEIDGIHYLTMPYIEGTALSAQINPDTPWNPTEAVDLIRRIALALEEMHQRGLIHRDLKPGNILIKVNGEPVVMDFGLARSISSQSQQLTRLGQRLGSPAYMAPEQVIGDRNLGPTTDIYALGVILFQLLTGELPFDGPIQSVYGQILHAPPPDPTTLRSDLDPKLNALCQKAMAKLPEERYPSMTAFADALAAHASIVPSNTGPRGSQVPPHPSGPTTRLTATRTGNPPSTSQGGASATQGAVRRIVCSNCRASIRVPPNFTGTQAPCPNCKTPIVLSRDTQANNSTSQESAPFTGLDEATPRAKSRRSAPGGGGGAKPPRGPVPGTTWLAVGCLTTVLFFTVVAGIGVVIYLGGGQSPETRQGTLQVLPLEDVELAPGLKTSVYIRVERNGTEGTLDLQLTDLPAGVSASEGTIQRKETTGTVEVMVLPGAQPGSARAQVLVVGDQARVTAPLQLTIVRKGVSPRIINSVGMVLVRIPAGKFRMGSPVTEEGHTNDEQAHEVEITRPFYIGAYEVTQKQFQEVMGRNPSVHLAPDGSANYPVDNVNWLEANQFCQKLSQLEAERKAGRTYRLPTEAEWEYACRAGTSTPFYLGSTLQSTKANFDGDFPFGVAVKGPVRKKTTAVGTFLPNPWGLYDTHGNVWEWCSDWYDGDYYANSPLRDPRGPLQGSKKVIRGGAWDKPARDCRSAYRGVNQPDFFDHSLGLRVVMERSQ